MIPHHAIKHQSHYLKRGARSVSLTAFYSTFDAYVSLGPVWYVLNDNIVCFCSPSPIDAPQPQSLPRGSKADKPEA